MGDTVRKGGKKNRKWNRNRKWCEMYFMACKRDLNKRIRMLRHANNFPADEQIRRRLQSLFNIPRDSNLYRSIQDVST